MASRGFSVRGACRGVGLAFARPAFWLVFRPRTRWPPCVQGENLTASMFANSSCHMKSAERRRPLETCHIRRGHALERWCGTGQHDRLMPPISVGLPSRNAGAAVLLHCTTLGPHGPLPGAPSAEVSRFSALFDFLGNPWFYTTFEDESQNRRLAMIAAGAHRAQWYRSVLLLWRQEFGDRARRSEREPRRRRLTERSAETQRSSREKETPPRHRHDERSLCVCWCATCDTHMCMYIYIYIYIHLVRICPHARKHCGFHTGETESNTVRSKLHTKHEKIPKPVLFLYKTQQSIFRLSRVVGFIAVCKRFAVLAAHITSPTYVENCANRKHGQKRIVKHRSALCDLRAL